MATTKRNVLGRGLDALITMDDLTTGGSSSIREIDLSQIRPNPDQPRQEFDEDSLQELAASIREFGIIQPITLRQMPDGGYQIVSGERRYRASSLAGLTSVPAYVRTVEDDSMVEMALIENIQREDLNPVEIALTFQRLIDQYHLTQDRLSERVGKKRATIANYLRLLRLPAEIQIGLKNKQIDMGHARALLSIDNPTRQLDLYERIQKQGYSVRKVEELAKEMQRESLVPSKKKGESASQEGYDILRRHLSDFFQMPVQFSCNAEGKGKISIVFKNEKELERLVALLDQLK
ncbi:MAG: ParB/RepB/Spo0J family partition protein [Prevotella sp.]|nr:ParB/RepB/Spo0J family partition protein [Porphyromonadaceae bacterium]MCD8297106.1 ParB/RepB/Spo0J family partition protein [Prevotella sp.]